MSQFAGNSLQKGVSDTQNENCRLFFDYGVVGEFVPVKANCPCHAPRPLCRLVRRAFFRSQCLRTASLARDSHWVFRRSLSNSAVAKYLTIWAAQEPPNGFNSPAAISTGMSCGLKPR
jgi:hypothetical protein